jgi:hypothetical protein
MIGFEFSAMEVGTPLLNVYEMNSLPELVLPSSLIADSLFVPNLKACDPVT